MLGWRNSRRLLSELKVDVLVDFVGCKSLPPATNTEYMKKKDKKEFRPVSVMAVWPCLGCMPSSRKMMGYRVCGHTKDTWLEAPIS